MTKLRTVRSDEANRLARAAAEQTRKPEVDDLNPTQRTTYEFLRALSRESSNHVLPGATSDHRDLYDEFGLPK